MTLAALVCGLAIGWITRGWLTSLIVRHAISTATQSQMSADIDKNVRAWFS